MITVCPISKLAETVEAVGARRILSLVADGMTVDRPASVAADHHLILEFHDIVAPLDGHVHPSESHIADALAFAAASDAPLVVHCYAGISRSTAMGFAIACAREPERSEEELASTLRRLSPSATPNRLIVQLADAALGRGGRMVAAVEAIGRGADAFEGRPFSIPPLAVE